MTFMRERTPAYPYTRRRHVGFARTSAHADEAGGGGIGLQMSLEEERVDHHPFPAAAAA